MPQVAFSVRSTGEPPRYTDGGHGFVTGAELRRDARLLIPEINSGFVPLWWYEGKDPVRIQAGPQGASACPTGEVREEDLAGRSLPLWFKVDVEPGQYRVTATLSAAGGSGEVLLFTGRRRLGWRGALRDGEQVQVSALCDVSPVIASGGGDAALSDLGRMEDTSLDIAVVGGSLAEVQVRPWSGRSLWIMGDSTVTDQPAQVPYAPGTSYAGWGQMLPLFLGEQYCVVNHAHSGLSTETFRERGHYDLMRERLQPGDLVLIQFGHNDQKRKHLAAEGGYTENLTRYIRELRELGAVPVLVTSLARNTWKSPLEYNDLLADYAAAVQKLGRVMDVPVLDLHGRMKDMVCRAGMEAARVWYCPGDFSHTNDFGAYMAAGFVAEGLARAGLAREADAAPWPVHGPLDLPAPPEELSPPEGAAPLVDYGLIPDAPWDIT